MDDVDDLALLSSLTSGGGGRGVGVMIDRPLVGAGAVLRLVGGDFVLEPLGRRVTPVGLSTAEVSAVDNLLDAAERPLIANVDDDVRSNRSRSSSSARDSTNSSSSYSVRLPFKHVAASRLTSIGQRPRSWWFG